MADERMTSDLLVSHVGYHGIDLASIVDIGADAWTHDPGTYASPVDIIQQDTAANNNTKTLGFRLPRFQLPGHYCDSASIDAAVETATLYNLTLNVSMRRTGTPNASMDLRAKVYESNNQGGFTGSNLYVAGDIDMLSTASSGTWAVQTFTVSGAAILRGDGIQAFIEIAQDDTGGSGGGIAEIGAAWWSFSER